MSLERHSWRGLCWKLGGPRTTAQDPWMRVQGAWGPSGQAISDGDFLLGFCVSLRIWAAVGESSPSLISPLSRAVGADAEDTGGRGETRVGTVRAACPVDPRSSYWPCTHLHSPQWLAQLWTLDLKGHSKSSRRVLGPLSAISIMRGEQEAARCRPLSNKVACVISNCPLTTGSAGVPARPDPREGAGHQAGPPGTCH